MNYTLKLSRTERVLRNGIAGYRGSLMARTLFMRIMHSGMIIQSQSALSGHAEDTVKGLKRLNQTRMRGRAVDDNLCLYSWTWPRTPHVNCPKCLIEGTFV